MQIADFCVNQDLKFLLLSLLVFIDPTSQDIGQSSKLTLLTFLIIFSQSTIFHHGAT